MAVNSKIEFIDSSWNPITGCTKYSEGCKFCYAEKLAKRLNFMGQTKYKNGFDITIHENIFKEPLSWKKPKKIFVCSMSDLFHEDISFDIINKIFATMEEAKQHTFQIITKRSYRLVEYASRIKWPINVWAGVTVESHKYISRINDIQSVDVPVRFIVFEPLLSPIPKQDFTNIQWVIVGGESGLTPRPVKAEWVRCIRDNCLEFDVPFLFKQWGGRNKKVSGRVLDGKLWTETPL